MFAPFDCSPKLPHLWFGYALAAAYPLRELFAAGRPGIFFVLGLASWLYWLFCVSRFHDVVNWLATPISSMDVPLFASFQVGPVYPISARAAVLRHFIPFYNLYWLFKWPIAMSTFVNDNTPVRMLPGAVLGLGLLMCLYLRIGSGFFGTVALFGIGSYIAAKLRRVLAERCGGRIAEVFA